MNLGKTIIIGLVTLVVLAGALVTWSIVNSLNEPAPLTEVPKNIDTTSASKDLSLHIDNFSAFPKLDSIKTNVTNKINAYLPDTPRQEAPKGIIREASYKEAPTGDGAIEYTFLVDIAALKITYKVSYTVGDTDGRRILYVICPSTTEMIYPPFNCKDDLSES